MPQICAVMKWLDANNMSNSRLRHFYLDVHSNRSIITKAHNTGIITLYSMSALVHVHSAFYCRMFGSVNDIHFFSWLDYYFKIFLFILFIFLQKNFHKGLMVLKEMEARGVKPDSQTFSYILGNCNSEDDIIKASKFWSYSSHLINRKYCFKLSGDVFCSIKENCMNQEFNLQNTFSWHLLMLMQLVDYLRRLNR